MVSIHPSELKVTYNLEGLNKNPIAQGNQQTDMDISSWLRHLLFHNLGS